MFGWWWWGLQYGGMMYDTNVVIRVDRILVNSGSVSKHETYVECNSVRHERIDNWNCCAVGG